MDPILRKIELDMALSSSPSTALHTPTQPPHHHSTPSALSTPTQQPFMRGGGGGLGVGGMGAHLQYPSKAASQGKLFIADWPITHHSSLIEYKEQKNIFKLTQLFIIK